MKSICVLLSLFASTSALAQQTKQITVPVPEFDFAYRFEGEHTDDGLKKDSHDDRPNTTLALRYLHVGLQGKVDPQFDYRVQVNLIGSEGPRFDVGYVRWSALSKRWDVVVGHQKINVYGFEAKDHSALTIVDSAGFAAKPFEYAPAVMFGFKSPDFGRLSAQVIQDASPAGGWNADVKSTQQTATALEWLFGDVDVGDGKLTPLVEVASYDLGHSKVLSAGAKFESKEMVLSLDVINDVFGAKGIEVDDKGNSKAKNNENTKSTVVFNGRYEGAAFSPFGHFSIYNYRDHTEAGQDEPKANGAGTFNDNGKVLGIGSYANGLSKKLKPYVAVIRKSGNFGNAKGDEEEMTVNLYKLGLAGVF